VLAQRETELSLVKAVQEGVAARLDFQSIVDRVGDRLRYLFRTDDLAISWFDEKANLIHILYAYEHGRRLINMPTSAPRAGGMYEKMRKTRSAIVLGTQDDYVRFGNMAPVPGTDMSKSMIAVPIFAGDRLLGDISIENFERENAFGALDVQVLTTVATSLAAALQSAWLFDETQRLLKETEQRNAELAVINSIQRGMSAKLQFHAIVDLVGDKIREVLRTGDIGIRWFDYDAKLCHYLYEYEHGERLPPVAPTVPRNTTWEQLIARREPRILNTVAETTAGGVLPGTDVAKSAVIMPIIGSDRVIGSIVVENHEREYAFDESNVRLLGTVASSMGIALENARLFDETERLLKETEQRNAELAVINSVQQGLAGSLDFQGIVDLVGDKLREILHTEDLGIRWRNPKTGLVHYLYEVEHGRRLTLPPHPLRVDGKGPAAKMLATRRAVVYNTRAELDADGVLAIEGTDRSLSCVFAPILGSGEVVGGIVVENYEREHAFGGSEVRLIETIAASLGGALENARLFDEAQRLLKETEQRNAELAVINSIQQGISAKLEFQAIVDLVGDKLREVFAGGDVGIRWYEPEANVIHFLYAWERGHRLHLAPTTPSPALLRMLESREPKIINTRAEYQAAGFETVPGTETSLSSIGIPIVGSDRVIGSIVIENYEREHAFGEAEVRLLTTVASSMGVALENARLFDETQRRTRETSALAEVGRDVSSTLDLETVMDRIARHAKELLHCDNSAIFLPDADGRHYHAIAALGTDEEQIGETEILAGAGIIGGILAEGRAAFVNDTRKDARAIQIPGTEFEENERLMVAPLLAGSKVKGALAVWRTGGRLFDRAELEFLVGLSQQAAVAIENARLFNETQQTLERQTATAEVLEVISSSVANPQPVFDKILDSCQRLFDATNLAMCLIEDDHLHIGASHGAFPPVVAGIYPRALRGTVSEMAIAQGTVVHRDSVTDASDMPAYLREVAQKLGDFSFACAPMTWEGQAIGTIDIAGRPPRSFS
jgi:GAF domain-containing protein